MNHPMIAARVFDTPLLCHPAKAVAFVNGLGNRIGGAPVAFDTPLAMEDDGVDAEQPRPAASLIGGDFAKELLQSGYGYPIVNGIAIISVAGVLVHRGSWVGKSSGVTSYEGLRAQIDAAHEDERVNGIALEIDCFGGEVAGCFDLADRIRAVAKDKSVRAFVTDYAFSAAYALAAACDQIVVSRTSGVGSIGVICMHGEFSGAMEKAGINVTIIAAGAHKAEGNSYEALPDHVRDEWASEMESLRQLFAETVGKGRGQRLTKKGALATEAACFRGQEAIDEGLADILSEPRAAFDAFALECDPNSPSAAPAASARARTKPQGGPAMKPKGKSDKTKDEDEPLDAVETEVETPEEDEDAPYADGSSDDDDGEAEDEEEDTPAPSALSEKDRIAAILDAPEAAGLDKLARHFAFKTDMTVADAKAALAAAKDGASPSASGSLSQRMAGRASARGLRPAGGAAPKEGVASRMQKRFPKD